MRTTSFLCSLLLICFFAVVPADAKPRQPAAKGKTVASKTTPAKRVVSKGKATKRGRTPVARRAPRQSEPTSERYMEIQQALVDKGYHPGPVNGQWSPEWVSSLKHFQEEQNLAADGKLGSLSLIALGLGPKREPIAQFAGKPELSQ